MTFGVKENGKCGKQGNTEEFWETLKCNRMKKMSIWNTWYQPGILWNSLMSLSVT